MPKSEDMPAQGAPRVHVHALAAPGSLPDVGRQWFSLDAVPDAFKNHIGEVLVLTNDMQVRRGQRTAQGTVATIEPITQGLKIEFWTVPPVKSSHI